MSSAYVPTQEEQEEFDRRHAEVTALEEAAAVNHKIIAGAKVDWQPLDVLNADGSVNKDLRSSQQRFLGSTYLEGLYHGTRGPGKTDTLLMCFFGYVNRGFGAAWRGILFRQTYPQLADVVAKSERWFRLLCPGAKFNKSKMQWQFPNGEVLMFRHMNTPSDYWNYHGHEYPFIGWEELTNWPTDECYKSMFSCCRCSVPGVPRMIRSTTNPYGVGHNWVKERWRLGGKWWLDILIDDATDIEGRPEPIRFAIHGHIDENYYLLRADPNYKQSIVASSTNKAMAKAWLHGSWAIIAGGMFGDVWQPAVHIVKPFRIPATWRLQRSFDWGSSHPFSVGWWATSDGSDYKDAAGKWRSSVRGDVFRFAEWYGWTGKANEGLKLLATDIAKGIVDREVRWGLKGKVKAGPADSSIFDTENGNCIADDMEQRVRLEDGKEYDGVTWARADKRPGSRKAGWEQMRIGFVNSVKIDNQPREKPGVFVFETCVQFIRTVPVLPRAEKDLDDVDTKAEDHIGDEARYFIHEMGYAPATSRTVGMF